MHDGATPMSTATTPQSNPRPARRRRPIFGWALLVLALLGVLAYFLFRVVLIAPPAQALSAGNALLRDKTVLAVVAHPDDLEWYIGGTLRRLADNGANVQVIVASSGEKGPNRIGAADLPATRRQEQLNAAKINGYTKVHFLNLPDRGVAADPNFLPKVQAIYNEVRPQAVFVFDPQFPSLPYLHVDHQGSAREFLGFWNTLGAGRPPVYLFQTRRPDVAVDISAVIDTKVRAMAQHLSQGGGGGGRMRGFFRGSGQLVGVEYAEMFRVLK